MSYVIKSCFRLLSIAIVHLRKPSRVNFSGSSHILNMENTLIISPAYNVSNKIGKVLCSLNKYKKHCLFINDGSTDNTPNLIEKAGFSIINMTYNTGISKSILTGLRYALEHDYKYVILMDADGQHNANDIEIMANHLKYSDAVFANRFNTTHNIPSCKITANAFASAIYKEISKYYIPDVSCGYKAFKITQKNVDFLSNTEGYSIIYRLVNYCIIQKYNVNYITTNAIYYYEDLLSTRTEELIALLSTAIQLSSIYAESKLQKRLNELLSKAICRQNFSAIFCNINFYAFYLEKYDSYILQAPLDKIHTFYNQGE